MIDPISADAFLKQMEQLKSSGGSEALTSQGAAAEPGEDFGKVLGNLITEVDGAQKEADLSLKKLATGETNSIQEVVMKMEEADVSFKLMLEIRNKLLQAYKDIMAAQ